jgi:beta-lactamase regulating signal transducer with metallopeptidase domain
MIASVKFLIPFSLLIAAGESLRTGVTTPIPPPALAVMQQITQPFSQTTLAADHLNKAPLVPEHYASLLSAILVAVWLCGFLSIVFSWVRGWRTIRAAVRASSPMQIKLPANVPVLSSPRLLEPGVFGIVRPVLLLPENISDRLSAPQLSAIVAHEVWHIRRRDNLTAAIHMLVVATFWFHPAVWWIRARLLEERERACDEAVLQSGNEAQVYAEGILSVCRLYVESPLECASGISGSDLKQRIARIMTQGFARHLTLGGKILLATTALAVTVLPIAFGLLNAVSSRAQSQDQDTNTAAHLYEVASIKPNKSGDNMTRLMIKPDGLSATGATLDMLIQNAYGVRVKRARSNCAAGCATASPHRSSTHFQNRSMTMLN